MSTKKAGAKRKILRLLTPFLLVLAVLWGVAGCGGGETAEVATTAETANTDEGATTAGVTGADESETAGVAEDGTYTSRDEVALYLHIYGKLPSNFITKKEAEELGWKKKHGHDGDLDVVAPGKSIGGSYFGNHEGQLPAEKGRKYYECDINYRKGSRGAERIIYSNDGLIFYTGDHYQTFEQLYPKE